ncbi:MAG TPA: DUF5818 domain-containing protein [Terriglobia bacterium]|nr:DUF5818 domain-containing protein [Terriglobia bacterium]
MKKLAISLTALLFLAGSSLAASKAKTFTGEIMDSQCAMMGSHAKMEQMHHMGQDSKMCTLQCVKMGGKFVLYNAAHKATYQLDNQDKPQEFAGQKVKVTGSYDKATKTIHVESIKAAS